MNEVVIIIPVLGRPERVEPLLASLERGRGETPYRALFVASPGDRGELRAIQRAGADVLVASWPPGDADWAMKTNLACRETSEPWIFTGADDLCFCEGWADRALECAAAGERVGVVGTDDLGNAKVRAGQHSTHSLVRRAYVQRRGTVDERGKLLHEGYSHNFSDCELVETAKARGAWLFCAESRVEHLHPNWSKGRGDRTYQKGQRHFARDRALFQRRRRLWAT